MLSGTDIGVWRDNTGSAVLTDLSGVSYWVADRCIVLADGGWRARQIWKIDRGQAAGRIVPGSRTAQVVILDVCVAPPAITGNKYRWQPLVRFPPDEDWWQMPFSCDKPQDAVDWLHNYGNVL